MTGLQFPITFTFKIGTISNDFYASDAKGKVIAYVRQKLFKLVDHIEVYSDESRNKKLYDIKANKWIDFSATYTFYDDHNNKAGSVGRKGMRSLWKASYSIMDKNDNPIFEITEENVWIKVLDGLVEGIPVLNLLTGYFLNPSYLISDQKGTQPYRIKKEPSLFGRRFIVNKLTNTTEENEIAVLLGTMMMLVLERDRG